MSLLEFATQPTRDKTIMKQLYRVLRNVLRHPLNRQGKIAAIRRFINWQIASRLAPGRIAVDWIGGTKFLASQGEAGVTGNVYCGLSDFEEMSFLLHFLRKEDTFADIGANAGIYTILASGVIGAKSVSFEPVPATYRRLLANIAINNMEDRVSAYNQALGSTTGEILFSDSKDCMNRVVLDGSTKDVIRVPVSQLDQTISQPITMIKLDVEGFEKSVLEGAGQTLANPDLKALIVELNGSGAAYGHTDDEVIAQLAEHGFEPFTYVPLERRLQSQTDAASRPPNLIFLRDQSWVESRLVSADSIIIREMSL
jgi:FkbM family methyltransferase